MTPDAEAIRSELAAIGTAGAEPVAIGRAALLLAMRDRPEVPLDRYLEHLEILGEKVAARAGGDPADALRAVLADEFDYRGDRANYEDLQNANLIRVIDRRKGLPVALGILYIDAARRAGLEAHGLNFPNHFLIRVAGGAGRAVLDPYNGGRTLEARDMRALLELPSGAAGHLDPAYHAPVSDRMVLLRLQNNIKLRLIRDGRLEPALQVVQDMRLIGPDQPGLLREEGMIQIRLGRRLAGLECLKRFLAGEAIGAEERLETARLVQVLESQLN